LGSITHARGIVTTNFDDKSHAARPFLERAGGAHAIATQAERTEGVVVKFFEGNAFGFLHPCHLPLDDHDANIFFTSSDVQSMDRIRCGMFVTYEVVDDERHPGRQRAVRIRPRNRRDPVAALPIRRLVGTLVNWHPRGAYGWIQPLEGGHRQVFVHLSHFHAGDEPAAGVRVEYQIGLDRDGRIRAERVRIVRA
jgi:cold shock CspA family protein